MVAFLLQALRAQTALMGSSQMLHTRLARRARRATQASKDFAPCVLQENNRPQTQQIVTFARLVELAQVERVISAQLAPNRMR